MKRQYIPSTLKTSNRSWIMLQGAQAWAGAWDCVWSPRSFRPWAPSSADLLSGFLGFLLIYLRPLAFRQLPTPIILLKMSLNPQQSHFFLFLKMLFYTHLKTLHRHELCRALGEEVYLESEVLGRQLHQEIKIFPKAFFPKISQTWPTHVLEDNAPSEREFGSHPALGVNDTQTCLGTCLSNT